MAGGLFSLFLALPVQGCPHSHHTTGGQGSSRTLTHCLCLPHPREDSRMHVCTAYIPHTATHTYMYHIHCTHHTQSHRISAHIDTPHITIYIYTIHHTYIPHTHIYHTIHMPDMYEHHSHKHTRHIPHHSHINIQIQKLGPWPLRTPMHQDPSPGFPDTWSFLLRDLFSAPSLF